MQKHPIYKRYARAGAEGFDRVRYAHRRVSPVYAVKSMVTQTTQKDFRRRTN
jgi:hypothetical protein